MEGFTQITPAQLAGNPFSMIGEQWLLLAAQNGAGANAMTCSWGGMGVLWKKDVAFIFVRHSRYTFGLMEQAERFSISWFDDPGHKLLGYFGRVSGRDEDKIAKSGLHCNSSSGAPVFAQAQLTMVCRKLYTQDVEPQLFVDTTILPACYGDSDFHRMYVGEIEQILQKTE